MCSILYGPALYKLYYLNSPYTLKYSNPQSPLITSTTSHFLKLTNVFLTVILKLRVDLWRMDPFTRLNHSLDHESETYLVFAEIVLQENLSA